MDSRRSMVAVLAGGGILALAIGLFFLFGTPDPGQAPEVPGPELQRPEIAGAETAPPRQAQAESRVATPAPAGPPAAAGEQEDERMRRTRFGLKGRVVDAGRQPVADMAVELFLVEQAMFMPSLESLCREPQSPPLRAGKTRTDAGGSFFLERLPSRRPGLLSLGVHTAQATFRILDRTPEPGETVDLGDIVLAESTTLSGTVVDDNGAAVAGARVRVADFPAIAFTVGAAWFHGEGGILIQESRGRSGASNQVLPFARWMSELERDLPLPETFTDESGQFRLVGMPAGKPSLWVQKRGLIPLNHGPVSAEPGKERALGRLVMQRGESVTGTVVDGAGKGVAGAEVLAGPPAMGGFPVTFLRPVGPTDAAGRFTIDATGRDKLMLVARRGPAESWVVDGPVDPEDDLVIKLEEACLLRVFVADDRGAALDGVELRLAPDHEMFQVAGLLPSLPLAQRTQRAEDGSYLLRDLSPGKLRIQARKPGHIPAESKVELTGAAESQLRLVLGPAAEGRVRVEDPAGAPVALARIYVKAESLGKGFMRGGIPVQIGLTDRTGEAVLREVPAGTHAAWVMHPEFGSARCSLLLPGPIVVVRMSQTGSIVGTLTRGGQPCADSYAISLMQVRDRNPADEIPNFTWTQPDGTFRFGSVVPGSYRIHPQARLSVGGTVNDVVRIGQSMDDVWGNSTEAVVIAGQECRVQLDIKVEDPSQVGRVLGLVTRNGRPAEGLTVNAWGGRNRRATTDAAGRFELEGVRAGRDIWLNISEPAQKGGDYRQIAQRNLKVKAGETVEIRVDVTTGHLRGRALLPDGVAAAETQVSLQGQAEGAEKNQGWVHYGAVTDAAGDFAVRDLVAGSYSLNVQKDGYVLANQVRVKVRPGEETAGIVVRLVKACQFGGRVVAEGGLTGAEHFWLHLRSKEGSPEDSNGLWANVNTNDGKFDPIDAAPGSYTGTLHGGKGPYRTIEVTITGTRLDAVLEFSKAPPEPVQRGK